MLIGSRPSWLVCLLSIALSSLASQLSAGELLEGLSHVATRHVNSHLAGKSFPIREIDHFQGEVSISKQAATVIITRCELKKDQLACSFEINGKCQAKGKIVKRSGDIAIDADCKLTIKVDGHAKLVDGDGNWVSMKSEIEKISATIAIISVMPASAVRSKEDLGSVLNSAIARENKQILDFLNKQLVHDLQRFKAGGPVGGADNPLLRRVLQAALFDELAKHSDQATAWTTEAEHTREKHLGITIRWKERTKAWVWIPNAGSLQVKVNRLALNQQGRFEFDASAEASVQFKFWGEIEKGPSGNLTGNALITVSLAGSFEIDQKGSLVKAQVSTLDGEISKLKFDNKVLDVLSDLLEDAGNGFLHGKNQQFKQDLEREINKLSL